MELNGHEAVVEGFDSDRYVVHLVDSDLYKKVKPEHLALPASRTSCVGADVGPKSFTEGMEVLVYGLTAAASMNGEKVLVKCFNSETGRYVVQLPSGALRAIKAEHLRSAKSDSDSSEVAASVESVAALKPGSHAKLMGLRNAAMNGKVVRVLRMLEEKREGRHYLVKLPNGLLRKVEASKLEESDEAPLPRLSVCNAFGRKLKVLLQGQSGQGQEISHQMNLDFQRCEDLEELPFEKGIVSFMNPKHEVARVEVDLSDERGLELTVAPTEDPHKARVHQNSVENSEDEAFFLHLIDARVGAKRAKLSVQRGLTAKVLPMDKTYRLERVEDMSLSLVDGTKKLKLAFTPQKARTYCAIVTGGNSKDTEKDGLVLHKLGAWTSAEQLADEVWQGGLLLRQSWRNKKFSSPFW